MRDILGLIRLIEVVLIILAVKKRKDTRAYAGTKGTVYAWKRRKYPQMDVCFSGYIGVVILYAITFMFMAAFIVTAIGYWNGNALEEQGAAGEMFRLVTMLVIAAVCAYAGRLIQQGYVYFDEAKLIVGRTFDSDLTLEWNEIKRAYVRVGKNRTLYLIDWNDRMCCFTKAGMQNFYQFYDMVMRKVPDTEQGRDAPKMMAGMDIVDKRRTVKLLVLVCTLLITYTVGLLYR